MFNADSVFDLNGVIRKVRNTTTRNLGCMGSGGFDGGFQSWMNDKKLGVLPGIGSKKHGVLSTRVFVQLRDPLLAGRLLLNAFCHGAPFDVRP